MWRGKEVTTRNRRSLTGTTGSSPVSLALHLHIQDSFKSWDWWCTKGKGKVNRFHVSILSRVTLSLSRSLVRPAERMEWKRNRRCSDTTGAESGRASGGGCEGGTEWAAYERGKKRSEKRPSERAAEGVARWVGRGEAPTVRSELEGGTTRGTRDNRTKEVVIIWQQWQVGTDFYCHFLTIITLSPPPCHALGRRPRYATWHGEEVTRWWGESNGWLSALYSSLHIPFVPSLHVPSLITSSPIHFRPTGPSGLPSVRTVMGEVRIIW